MIPNKTLNMKIKIYKPFPLLHHFYLLAVGPVKVRNPC